MLYLLHVASLDTVQHKLDSLFIVRLPCVDGRRRAISNVHVAHDEELRERLEVLAHGDGNGLRQLEDRFLGGVSIGEDGRTTIKSPDASACREIPKFVLCGS